MSAVLVIALIIGGLVILFMLAAITDGLFGGAGIVSGIATCGGGCLLLGVFVIVVVSVIGGFMAGRLT